MGRDHYGRQPRSNDGAPPWFWIPSVPFGSAIRRVPTANVCRRPVDWFRRRRLSPASPVRFNRNRRARRAAVSGPSFPRARVDRRLETRLRAGQRFAARPTARPAVRSPPTVRRWDASGFRVGPISDDGPG